MEYNSNLNYPEDSTIICARCKKKICSKCGRAWPLVSTREMEATIRLEHLHRIIWFLGYQFIWIVLVTGLLTCIPSWYKLVYQNDGMIVLYTLLNIILLFNMDHMHDHLSNFILLTWSAVLIGILITGVTLFHSWTEIKEAFMLTVIIVIALATYVHRRERDLNRVLDYLSIGLCAITVLGIIWLLRPWASGKLILSSLCGILTCLITVYELHVERWFPIGKQRSAMLRSATLGMHIFVFTCSILVIRHLVFRST
ncbi:membrane protein S20 [Saimiriine betaherpesvirus 4]|uniref:Membrane protein S20 n=1 Tax=Saimiriine betaherpesvirus 4 TaxID=1535247 RepID=G8XT46_9BETA|nr:membrane protein S20 [Saimiriine betaherpesvirus 4]AEV80995.1 membrane protein S20 [Saimiriine betaherpesvirus 4]